jgi:glycosyltransferase involved in cell wall biosynthesis
MTHTKILFCHNYYQHAGGESLVFESEVAGVQANGHPVALYTRSNLEIGRMNAARRASVFLSAYSSGRTIRELRDLVQREQPQVAVVQNVFPLMSPSTYRVLHSLGVPIIQAVYNYRFICPSAELYTNGAICERCIRGNYLPAVRYRCYRRSHVQSAWYASIIGLHRRAGTFAKIDAFMVPDQFLGDKLVEAGIASKDKIWRNPNPFDITFENPAAAHQGRFLYVGRLTRQKGVLTLLEAMTHTPADLRLDIIGQGELADALQTLIRERGLSDRVALHAPQWGENMERFLRDCAAVIIPSQWYDNLPQILCQANMMGKPVIASRINGIPEYVAEDRNGFLFPPGDAGALAAAMKKVWEFSSQEYASLSARTCEYARGEFSYPAHYQKLLEIIASVRTEV